MTKNTKKIGSIKNKLNLIKEGYLDKKKSIYEVNKGLKKNIKYKEKELINFYLKKKNALQDELIREQYKLINIAENYKSQTIIKLEKNNQTINKILNEKNLLKKANRNFKETINRYVKYTEKVNNKIDRIENMKSENLSNKRNIGEMKNKIKFLRDENLRLSKEFNSINERYSKIKMKLTKNDNDKNNFLNQIRDLKETLTQTKLYDIKTKPKINQANFQKLPDFKKNLKFTNINEEINQIFKDN